jgi:hypothetical protein
VAAYSLSAAALHLSASLRLSWPVPVSEVADGRGTVTNGNNYVMNRGTIHEKKDYLVCEQMIPSQKNELS